MVGVDELSSIQHCFFPTTQSEVASDMVAAVFVVVVRSVLSQRPDGQQRETTARNRASLAACQASN